MSNKQASNSQKLSIGTLDNHGNTEITETVILLKCRVLPCFFAKML